MNPARGRSKKAVLQFADLVSIEATKENHAAATQVTASGIRFEETALIPFQYFNGDDPTTKGVRMFEQTGGGVAIVDFDLDGCPDVFLPQGATWETDAAQPTPGRGLVDRLYRNRLSEVFSDANESLTGPDSGFGQGCSTGDFNNDGFPDLYVANTGQNCLYENMGDGTFRNVTRAADIADKSWSASVMVCDLNADGLPDLFDVNYVTGPDVYKKICRNRGCSPSVFSGSTDRLWVNMGDGRFAVVPNATPSGNSKGLGVVAFESELKHRPTLFISNDQVENFLLKNTAADNDFNIALQNEALVSGLAFNYHGLAMASMGVAIDDLDRNGLLDIFTTNFQNESNTLYLQDSQGLFVDASKTFGLESVSMPFTGWGTQALDADLDGLPDLVVANGHVDDGREFGGDYHQRPQFFRNLGRRFEELTAADVGPWFSGMYLGRGLARVDWNQDGRPEFIVSNINAPVSVLKNTTGDAGHFARFRLIATRTARDAIGTRVTLLLPDGPVTRQLLAGDGYMASNERVVEFGLGELSDLKEVVIRWPSGGISVLRDAPIDSLLTIVEGRPTGTQSVSGRPYSISIAELKDPQP